MQGVGYVFGVDAECDDWDLAWLGTFDLPAGCWAAFYPGGGTKDGHALLARNFDFATLTHSEILGGTARPGEAALAADPWIIELYPDHGSLRLRLGFVVVARAFVAESSGPA